MAPIAETARVAMAHSGVSGRKMPTRSPGRTPRARRPAAHLRTAADSSPYVSRAVTPSSPSKMIAVRVGSWRNAHRAAGPAAIRPDPEIALLDGERRRRAYRVGSDTSADDQRNVAGLAPQRQRRVDTQRVSRAFDGSTGQRDFWEMGHVQHILPHGRGDFPDFCRIGWGQDLEALGRNRNGYVRRRDLVRIEDDAPREASGANGMLVAREAE